MREDWTADALGLWPNVFVSGVRRSVATAGVGGRCRDPDETAAANSLKAPAGV